MKAYEFTLKYRLGDASVDPEQFVEPLAEAGCDDALVGIGQNGRIALQFNRQAGSAYQAIASAIGDVQRAIPDAKLVEATPDLVGVTDIAEVFGVSRQYVRKIIQSSGASFPEPVHEGKPSLWHLVDILTWFREHQNKDVSAETYEVSAINMRVNIYKSCLRVSSKHSEGFRFDPKVLDGEFENALRAAARP